MLNIAIRADGGGNVGLGHVMRCISLANAFRRAGHKVYFFSKLTEGIEKARAEGFEVIPLPSVNQETEGFFYGQSSCLDQEADDIIALIDRLKIDILVIDSYHINQEYFSILKKAVYLVYIDDLNKFSYPTDVIVNGNITGEYLDYEKNTYAKLLLLGPKYNMIREEFTNIPLRVTRDKVSEVMITTGGSDPYNLTAQLLGYLLTFEQFSKLRFNVIVGSSFTHVHDLIDFSNRYNNVVLYANSGIADSDCNIIRSDISSIMLRSDIAISAGGSTLYELAACGTPTLAFIMADNQEFIVHKMHELRYIENLGWYNVLDERKVINSIRNLINDFSQRQSMSSLGQRLVDGKGTARISDDIINHLGLNNRRV